MEEVIKEIAKSAPSLAVLVLLVRFFFQHVKERDQAVLQRDKERDVFIKNLHEEHLAARGESREAIRDNTVSNREIVNAVHTLTDIVKDRRI